MNHTIQFQQATAKARATFVALLTDAFKAA